VTNTYKSLAVVWLITFGLFALTRSGAVTGPWLLPFVWSLLQRRPSSSGCQRPVGVTTTSHERARVISDECDRSSLGLGVIDVYRWENEGGAPPMYVSGGIRQPAHAAS
jgi:hypothetical protein